MNPPFKTVEADYRYMLTRVVGGGERSVCWIMLNPSTADEQTDDPTIRRVMMFSKDNGFDRLVVVNLFAARATQPDDLLLVRDPIGPDNMHWIRKFVMASDEVVFAWGAWVTQPRLTDRMPQPRQDKVVIEYVEGTLGRDAVCLGKNHNGSPKHPLYIPASVSFEPYVYPRRRK